VKINILLFFKQPSPQLVDDGTCGTIPFPLLRELLVYDGQSSGLDGEFKKE
jgi:hypothetical protein